MSRAISHVRSVRASLPLSLDVDPPPESPSKALMIAPRTIRPTITMATMKPVLGFDFDPGPDGAGACGAGG
jgi:hypothetical protein